MVNKVNIPWNKGLTKDTDERVKMIGIKGSKLKKGKKPKNFELFIKKAREVSRKGKKLSQKTREKISIANRKLPEMYCEYCVKLIEGRKRKSGRKYCSRECFSKGVKDKTNKILIKCSNCKKEFYKNKSTIVEKQLFFFCSMKCKKECKKYYKYLGRQIKNSEKYKEGIKNSKRIYEKGVHYSPKTEFKKGWNKTEDGKRMIKKRAKILGQHQSKAEKKAMSIIKEYDLPLIFVGDGKILVGTKNPDFVYNKNGRKIVEIYSDYWHRDDIAKYWHQTEEGAKKYYDDLGYNCLIIWEKELKYPEKVVTKINHFLDTTIEIDNVPKEIYDTFVTLTNCNFDGNGGLCLQWILTQANEYQSMKALFFDKLENMENKIDSLINKQEQKKPQSNRLGKRIESEGGKK